MPSSGAGAGGSNSLPPKVLICQNLGKETSTFLKILTKLYFFVAESINKNVLCHRKHTKCT